MGHKNKRSFAKQIQDRLDACLSIGVSKHADKQKQDENGRRLSDARIYSWNTYRAYLQHANIFAQWIKTNYPGIKTLADARPYVDIWLCSRVCNGLSAYTVKLDAAALAKVYGCSTGDFGIITPPRLREEITRSRGKKIRDRHFSEKNNAELIAFCRCCGLRRSELEKLRGTDLVEHKDGSFSVHVISGKGGRDRYAPVVGTQDEIRALVDRMHAAGNEKVWKKVHNAADIHGYRREYAARVYAQHARDVYTLLEEKIPDPDHSGRMVSALYKCRGKKYGHYFDRAALLEASKALGHNRVDVVARHYLD